MGSILLNILVTCWVAVIAAAILSGQPAFAAGVTQISGILIPPTFALALREGMSIPLLVHFENNSGAKDDQRIGHALLLLENNRLKIGHIILEENDSAPQLTKATRQRLMALNNADFDDRQRLVLSDAAWLALNFHQLHLQLVVKEAALGTVFRERSSDIGASSVGTVSSTLAYSLGIYDNRRHASEGTTSSYLSLNNVTSLREHHLAVNGSVYGIGSPNQDSTLYKVMYERDFAGRRFAAGMLDSWNLQSLGPVTAINSGKIFGISYGNRASSTRFDRSQSLIPIVAFFPSAGEVHLSRDGRLLSVQNFAMGNHEVDSGNLPFGIYDVQVEVVVNGQAISRRTQRVNKLYSPGNTVGAPLSWQYWGGLVRRDEWRGDNDRRSEAKDVYLLGASAAGFLPRMNWALSGYSLDHTTVAEARFSLPITESLQVSTQSMAASDSSWSLVNSVSTSLPGGFSTLWVNEEKTVSGSRLRQNAAHNRAFGGSLSLGALVSKLGTLSVSYNEDKKSASHYYNVDYYQSLFSGRYGSLGMRTGIQRYNNGYSTGGSGKYLTLDLSLPLGSGVSAGIANQNGYTMANIAARKEIATGSIRSVGANLSRAISGGGSRVNGGAYARFDSKYSTGTVNVSSSADGYVNSNLTANGSVGWQGRHIAASGRSDGNSGVIINTGLAQESMLTARVDGRLVKLIGDINYLPLSPYGQYVVELMNNQHSAESFEITTQRKSRLTLYPGNVAVIEPQIKQRVTVFGRLQAEDGSPLANVTLTNPSGRTYTDELGEFVMDIDKKFPMIDSTDHQQQSCEAALDLSQAQGAVWVGDVVCRGLKTTANLGQTGAMRL
ncbi:fimbrial biogenesis outer membrane usher protein [Serratia silvae]|uniref:CS1-pili formation C-terminal domain-containing protein n=1 Tax=Serratia silvae TaxID=2824122 RepID=A0ABT0KCU9_9GAMM|nr:CS1-pili formation C-terminal domain-containing protein [Serratia silvae]